MSPYNRRKLWDKEESQLRRIASLNGATGQCFTEDGYKLNFQVYHLSNFLLVLLLLKGMDHYFSRVIFLTSWAQDPKDALSRILPLKQVMWRPLRDLAQPIAADGKCGKPKGGLHRYVESKLWLMMFMHALQSRFNAEPELRNVSVPSIDPGGVFSTGIMRGQAWLTRGPIQKLFNALTPFFQSV